MEEIWKDIFNYEGFYQVSNLGRVRGLDRYVYNPSGKCKMKVKGRLLKLHIDTSGYKKITLKRDGFAKNKRVHRLVAETFLDNPNDLKQVNHIDGDKLNNAVSNLEFCTAKDNFEHAIEMGLTKRGLHGGFLPKRR